jgi:uncharacterized Zn finger protein (UPF0148 family)
MVCKNCNHEIDNGAMFCTYCGTPVEQTSEPETQPVENASTEDAAQNPYENVQTAQPEVDNAQPTADSQSQQNPYSQQYGQPNQAYYQQPQPNKTSYGQQFTNSPNNDYGANQSKYGNQYQSYNNGYNQQYNTQYQQTYNSQPVPPVVPPYGTPDTQPVSIGGWIGVMLLTCLPIVNLIMLFVWAFSSSTKKSLKNYARAALILALIGVVLVVVVSIILAVSGISIFDEFFRSGYYYH